MTRFKVLLSIVLAVSLIVNIWFLFLYKPEGKKQLIHDVLTSEERKYPLISKRVLLEYPNDLLINFLPLREKLRQEVGGYNKERDTFAMYFEYLPTGTSIGIEEKTDFTAASLFKIPIIMAYYHKKERLDIHDDPTVTIKPEDIDHDFGTLWQKGAGAEVNMKEAVNRAIIDSDNTAIKLVSKQIDEEDFNAVYAGLDIDLMLQNDTVVINAKQFSSLLKALYFSSMLNKEDSQEILDLMTKTRFTDKLPAGVPQGILVAHKIGTLTKDNKMFMDCGVVYVPRRPYLLCMISVTDESTARERMKYISKTVYDYVAKTATNNE